MTEPFTPDQEFIQRLSDIVLVNIHDEHFGVNDFARTAGVSRYVIHRRLAAIRNQNASQFIREIRLKRAMELLQQHAGTASQIAYQVGFGSPAYFNKCFHKYYGYPPGEVKKRVVEATDQITDFDAKESSGSEYQTTGDDVSFLPVHLLNRYKVVFRTLAVIVVVAVLWGMYSMLKNRSDRLDDYSHEQHDLSIIVLPFKNFSNDPENQYFADGIMEDILNHLYIISDLRVVSRTTSERFRGSRLTSREVSRKSGARNVLEGSVRRYGDQVRISVQLIDGLHDKHLWSDSYDRELVDIMGVQEDIAKKVAYRLNAVLSDSELMRLKKTLTSSPEAYDHYLRGRFLLHKANSEQRSDFDSDGVMACVQYFEKAIAADENFAAAYAGLANAMFNLSAWGLIPMQEGFPKARELSVKAIEIDPECAEAYAVLGAYLVWPERRFEEANAELRTSIRLNPNFSTAHQWLAQLLMITGPIDEARLHIDRSLELEPYFWVTQNLNAWIYYFEEKYDEALQVCSAAKDLKQDYTYNKWLQFLNHAKLGNGNLAARELEGIVSSIPDAGEYVSGIWEAFKKDGTPGLFSWLIEINTQKPIPVDGLNGHPFFISWWHALLGNREESIYWLQKNMESTHRLYVYFNLIATNPDFDILRDDQQFLAIIDDIGLTDYNTRAPR